MERLAKEVTLKIAASVLFKKSALILRLHPLGYGIEAEGTRRVKRNILILNMGI